MRYQTIRPTRSSGIWIKLILLLSLFCATSNKVSAILMVTQSDVQETNDCYITKFRITNTSSVYVFRTVELISFDLYELSCEIADLGTGYNWQDIWDAFSVDITAPPDGEVFNGWTVSKDMYANGRFSMNHDSAGYDIWTSDEESNEMTLALSIEKKYFGPNYKLSINPNEIYCGGISVFMEDDGIAGYHDTCGFKVVAVPEPATLALLGLGGSILRKRKR